MKIVLFDCPADQEIIFKAHFAHQELFFARGPLNENTVDQAPSDAAILCVNHCSTLSKKVLDYFKTISHIITRSTGFDHINIKEARARKIPVCYAPHYAQEAVAEHTIALIFCLARKIPQIHDALINHHSLSLKDSQGMELKGKTIGVVGTGSIGLKVLKLAHCLGMKSIAYDIVHHDDLAQKYAFSYCTLDELLSRSDFICLHAPLTKKTYHLINRENIKQIKKGAYLINTARGALVQTEALLEALAKNILSGVALDVMEDEPSCAATNDDYCIKLNQTSEILAHDSRVLITPHIAYNTQEALERLTRTTIETIDAIIDGKTINEIL